MENLLLHSYALWRNLAAEEGVAIDPDLCVKLSCGGEVDDVCAGRIKPNVDRMQGDVKVLDNGDYQYSGTLPQVFAEVRMKPKVIVDSSETDE